MAGGAELLLDGVEVGYGDTRVIQGIGLRIRRGSFVGLIGPNACGKSTLLRAASRVLRPSAGRIVLDGRDLWRQWGQAEAARTLAVVPNTSYARHVLQGLAVHFVDLSAAFDDLVDVPEL